MRRALFLSIAQEDKTLSINAYGQAVSSFKKLIMDNLIMFGYHFVDYMVHQVNKTIIGLSSLNVALDSLCG
ncbi:hypothetical protein TMatcc_000260 [Talaromyces marneffei ATCC 18224]